MVSRSTSLTGITPDTLRGPVKTQVTALTRFRNTTQRRIELNAFIQNGLPQASEVMGRKGKVVLWRQVLTFFGLKDVNEIIPEDGDWDARMVAERENELIMQQGEFVQPKPEENHTAQIADHENEKAMW